MNTCMQTSVELDEAMDGTAAVARTWLLIEQPGPWGAKALGASRLDPAVGRALDRLAAVAGVRVALIRRPGRHPDRHRPGRHRVLLAHTAPEHPWVRTAEVTDPAELTALDFTALGAGEHGGFGTPYQGPPIGLVCTNGKRDRCCAVHGRPLATELAASGSGGIWETTHLGGHRFAPTMLVLPHGYAYGRMDGRHAQHVLAAAAAGRVVLDNCRGRSSWERPGQAAELAIRRLTGEEGAGALTVDRTESDPGGWTVRVTHTDGRAWRVAVAQHASTPPRPESCGGALGTPTRMEVTAIKDLLGSHAS
ncbi:sucrase ferredoxin [Actinacidiphila sp. ITFR-21]|uniref:sucrase ferredoxin n=1 Tax=Actinacidiphila sp. ITFR-21 TaxID=3075199 RepID=UPI00288B2105|nr:sucrase ferredoxin [Streptomyces sp. ITFR-21]WNI18416.1 sucrase ferredoxin [Streptomyces sp. ITFR-21]